MSQTAGLARSSHLVAWAVVAVTVSAVLAGLDRSGIGHAAAYVLCPMVVATAAITSMITEGDLGISGKPWVNSCLLSLIASSTVSLIGIVARAGDLSAGPVTSSGVAGSLAALVGVFAVNQLMSEPHHGTID